MSNEKEVLFTINGFTVRKDSTYLIKDKPHFNGPDGFAKARITKVPGPGIDNTFRCRSIQEEGTNHRVWDTGFYEFSPCYKGMDLELVKKEVASLQEKVVEPYRRAIGDPEALKQTDDKFWDNYRMKIYTKKVFNTNSPVKVLELYFALRAHEVAPKGKEREYIYQDAAYIVIDSHQDTKVKDEKASELFRTIGMFNKMYETQKPVLMLILNYVGMPVSADVDEMTLVGMFNEYINSDHERSVRFLKLVAESEKEDGKAKLAIYKELREMVGKGGKVTKTPSGVFYYDGFEIGPDLKSAAENISKNSELLEIKRDILLSDED